MSPFQPVTTAKPIVVEPNLWIGAGVIVLPGVTIGQGPVGGAGSVVVRSLPPGVAAAGNPARVIRRIEGPADLDRLCNEAPAV